MDSTEFRRAFEQLQAAIEDEFDHWVPKASARPETLHRAIRHSLEAGGKRLRPVLVCALCEVFSQSARPLPAATAIECLHTYTLIHDDLPAMDNSDLRRGRPTCHRAFGEAAAILAGDGLLTLSFEILANAYADHPALANQLVLDLARASGSLQLVGGQMDDIENEGKQPDIATLSSINGRKTGALIAVACTMGSRIGGASTGQIPLVHEFGACLGEAFQVIDDILDFTGTEKETGKSSGRDQANHKHTMVTLEGLDSSRARVRELTRHAQILLRKIGGNTAFLSSLVNWMAERQS